MFAGLRSRWDDALFVCGFERFGNLLREWQRLLLRDWAANESLCEILALDHFKDQKTLVVDVLETVNGADVRVIERGQDAGLTLEAGKPFRIGCQRLRQELEGDVAPEAGVVGAKDLAHAALTDLLYNRVMCEFLVRHDPVILHGVSGLWRVQMAGPFTPGAGSDLQPNYRDRLLVPNTPIMGVICSLTAGVSCLCRMFPLWE